MTAHSKNRTIQLDIEKRDLLFMIEQDLVEVNHIEFTHKGIKMLENYLKELEKEIVK